MARVSLTCKITKNPIKIETVFQRLTIPALDIIAERIRRAEEMDRCSYPQDERDEQYPPSTQPPKRKRKICIFISLSTSFLKPSSLLSTPRNIEIKNREKKRERGTEQHMIKRKPETGKEQGT